MVVLWWYVYLESKVADIIWYHTDAKHLTSSVFVLFLLKEHSFIPQEHITFFENNEAENSALHHMNELHFEMYFNRKWVLKL